MAKVEITIRCVKCNAKETVVIPAWAALRTSCGCNGPYQILERKLAPEEPPAPDEAKKTEPEAAGKEASADRGSDPPS